MKLIRANTARPIFIEPLELRVAPSGVITVNYDQATGALTLTGDALANSVIVSPAEGGGHRILGTIGTTLSTGGDFLDIGKLTSVNFIGNGDSDDLDLVDLNLAAFTFDGGTGNDSLTVTNTTVKGDASIDSGADTDSARFDGLHTTIKGNLNAEAGNALTVELDAQKTSIAGSIVALGGTGAFELLANGAGPVVIGKGVDITTGAGSANLQFIPFSSTTIGKLPTGESIFINGGNSADTLFLGGGNITLVGGIAFTGGSSAKSFEISAPNSTVKIGKLPSGHSILETGSGFADLTISALNFTAAGGIELTPGAGTNSLRIEGPNGKATIGKIPATGHSINFNGTGSDHSLSMDVGNLTLVGGIAFTSAAPTKFAEIGVPVGSAKIGKLTSGESILFEGGSGSDFFQLDVPFVTLAGGIAFSGGNGSNSLDLVVLYGRLNLGKLPTGDSILFTGGTGPDTIFFTPGKINTTGGIAFTGGDGANGIRFLGIGGNVTLGKLPSGQSIHFIGGANNDRIEVGLNSAVFAGGVEFAGGNASNDFLFNVINTAKFGALPTGESILFTGGINTDIVSLFASSMALKGALAVSGNFGSDTIEIGGPATTLGKNPDGESVFFDGGDGNDLLVFENSINAAGSILFTGGPGGDTFSFNAVDVFSGKGQITFDGGPDPDEVTIDAHLFQLNNALTVNGGDGNDNVVIIANGSITGDVTLDLGANALGAQGAVIASHNDRLKGLTLRGNFTLTGTGVGDDGFTIRNIVIAKDFAATLGDGISFVQLDNFSVGGTLTLNTGDGLDEIFIERDSAFGPSTIAKLATIQTGGGNDTLLIGSPVSSTGFPDPTRVRFLEGLTVDGGAGTNTRNAIDTENDFPNDPPTGLNTFTNVIP